MEIMIRRDCWQFAEKGILIIIFLFCSVYSHIKKKRVVICQQQKALKQHHVMQKLDWFLFYFLLQLLILFHTVDSFQGSVLSLDDQVHVYSDRCLFTCMLGMIWTTLARKKCIGGWGMTFVWVSIQFFFPCRFLQTIFRNFKVVSIFS